MLISALLLVSAMTGHLAHAAGPVNGPTNLEVTWVEIPAKSGEDLVTALRRADPCLNIGKPEGLEVLQAIERRNREKVDGSGRYVLAEPTLRVPKSFAQSAEDCVHGTAPTPTDEAIGVDAHAAQEKPGTERPAMERPAAEKEEAKEKEEEGPRRHLKVGATIEGARLDALSPSGANIVLTSKPRYGFEIDALEERQGWIFGAGFNWETAKFEEPDGRELSELNTTEAAAELRIGHVWAESIELQLGLGASQVDRIQLPNDEEVITSNSWMPRATLETKFNVFRSHGLQGFFAMGGALWVPFVGGRSLGVGEEAAFTLEHEINSHLGIQMVPHIGYERQETSDDTHSEMTYGLGIMLVGRN